MLVLAGIWHGMAWHGIYTRTPTPCQSSYFIPLCRPDCDLGSAAEREMKYLRIIIDFSEIIHATKYLQRWRKTK